MKKITFIGHTMNRGGASKVLSILSNHFSEIGYEVELVFFHIKNKYEISDRVNLVQLFDNNEKIKSLKALLLLRKYFKKTDSEIIVSFLMPVNLLVIIASRGFNKKIVISERNDPLKSKGRLWMFLSNILYNKADFIIFQTKRVRSYFSNNIQRKSAVILNPVKVDFESINRNSKKIVNIGKLYPQKNHRLLINAFYEIQKKYQDYSLHIYGEGPLRKNLEKQIDNLELKDSVILHGICSNVHKEIVDAEMFVLSSNYEGLSNALMEAMMMGIPCISTDCAGSDEIINNGFNGLLVPIGNSEILFSSMEKLVVDKKLAKEISETGKKDSIEFNKDNVLLKWQKIIDHL